MTIASTAPDPYGKAGLRLLPFLMLCYVAAFLDRVNVGFAKLTMLPDLHLSEAAFGFGAGLFFVGYFIFETPSNMLMHRIGARATLSRIMILWGLISGAFAFVHAGWQFHLLRFLLGAAEAGFYPGVILYLTYWFPAARRARIVASFLCAIPLSGLLGSPLSGWALSSLDGVFALHGWQWLFILEAVPSILLGFAVLAYLDDRPERAAWLSAEEKERIRLDLEADEADAPRHAGLASLASGIVVLLAVVVFCQAMGQYGLSFWLPTLIAQAGVKDPLTVGLLSAIPFGIAVASMLLGAWSSDRTGERRWHLVAAFLVGGAGLTASALLAGDVPAAMAALSVAAGGCYTVSALVWILPPQFLSGLGAAAGIAVINSVGALAGFLSPFAIGWIKETTRSTGGGLLTIAACMLLGAFLTLFVPQRAGDGAARAPTTAR